MIKVEKLTSTSIALVDGRRILEGQLITHEEFKTLVVEVGEVTLSIDEKELVTIKAPADLVPEPEVNVDQEPKIEQEVKEVSKVKKVALKVAKTA
jgi:hypothetical protein